ncbi:MAG: GT2 family glycosyltransferase [Planctomycetota bacterium]|jgi:GT2 family glycosyltransferase
MRDCVILGADRFGTNRVAAVLAELGYETSKRVQSVSMPKGLFETVMTAGGEPSMRSATKLVCVFRHPKQEEQGVLEDSQNAYNSVNLAINATGAVDLWTAMYREVFASHLQQGDWLFLHADQLQGEEGRARLQVFLEMPDSLDVSGWTLPEGTGELELQPETASVYARLCELAEFEDLGVASHQGAREPVISVLSIISEGQESEVDRLVKAFRSQRGIEAELVLIDQTAKGEISHQGTRVVRCDSLSRGEAWRAGLEASRGAFVAWLQPGCVPLPSQWKRALQLFESDDRLRIVTCDYFLCDDKDEPIERSHPGGMGEAPGPFWESSVVMRREALSEISSLVFHPVELKLWQRLRAQGHAGHIVEPGFKVPKVDYDAGWERSRQDAALRAFAEKPFVGERPEITVTISTINRRVVVAECIEAFCRQLLPYGTFEIVLVSDGSTDGTVEMFEGHEFPVPFQFLHFENRGAAAARNSALELSSGRLVMFVNDDTIPIPECIGHHLRAHAKIGPNVKAAVLGLFVQPQEAQSNTLLRYLETSTDVFAYAQLKPGALHSPMLFYTCNVSVSLEDVRRVGAFDPSFRHYGCEDTDLGMRLGEIGYRIYYEPAALAYHRHLMDLDYIKKRQHTVARAYVRFFRKHPQVILKWGIQDLDLESNLDRLAEMEARLGVFENAARELSSVNVGALEDVGGAFDVLVGETLDRLGQLFTRLNRVWWFQGYVDGFREHGILGFGELLAEGVGRYELDTRAERKLLAWPKWDDLDQLQELMDRVRSVALDGFSALVLLHDERRDPDYDISLAALEAAYERCFGATDAGDLEVLIESMPRARSKVLQLGRSVNALLPLGGESVEFLDLLGAERLRSEEDVASWRRRYEPSQLERGLTLQPVARASAGQLEVSVIVATHDRPRELVQLVERLKEQDLAPELFEVIIVDDASAQPARDVLANVASPFYRKVITQRAAGPGAARNRGIEHARGEIVVFLNDDAVPATDNLRRHLESHRSRSEPHSAMGTFSLLPELVVDSFTEYTETSRALFAQPFKRNGEFYSGLSLCSGNLSVPRSCLESVGGFDEAFPYAGGEDCELGLRLERELGMRVLFDASIRSEHDHHLNVEGFLRRMRVIGWAAYRIESKHGDVGLVSGRPADEAGWIEMQQLVESEVPLATEIMRELVETCAHERTQGLGAANLERLRSSFKGIGEYGQRCGLLAAHAGRFPDQSDEILSADARSSPAEFQGI